MNKLERILVFSLAVLGLVGCNLPQSGQGLIPSAEVTHAFQTINARLTQVATQASTETPRLLPTDSGVSTPTPTSPPLTETRVLATDTPAPTAICDRASPGIPIDVTIPDDTQMQPGQSFTKIWRLQNAGSCTWTTQYQVELFSGEAMGSTRSVYMPKVVQSGNSVDIAVDLVAPRAGGKYQGNWKLRNPSGAWFGIGPNGNSPFWVRIIVLPPPTNTPTPVTPTPTASPTPDVQASGPVTLLPAEKLDLDLAQVNPESGEDLAYEQNSSNQHLLAPQGTTLLGIFGSDQPNLEDCQSESMGSAAFVVEELGEGTFLCYRTGEGRAGWFQLVAFKAEDASVTLEILTWASP